jgi:hypothetical protein
MMTVLGTGESPVASVVQTLRWIAVLPGAVVAAVLSLIPLHMFLYLASSRFFEVYPEAPERILSPALLSSVFICVGSHISPTYKFETAIVLFGIWMFLIGGFVFLALTGSNLFGRPLYFRYGAIPTLMAVVGAVVGLVVVRTRLNRTQ